MLVAHRIKPMNKTGQQLEGLARFLRSLASRLLQFTKTTLSPLTGFLWHSSMDFATLVITRDNLRQLLKGLLASLMRLERLIESLLPERFRHELPLKSIGLLAVLLLLTLTMSRDTSIAALQEAGELVVITRESPTTLYLTADGPAGPEYDYLKSFADYLGVELRLVFLQKNSEVIAAINNGEGHIAAAGMTLYPPLEEQGMIFGPGYQNVDIQVICRRNNGKLPSKIEELADVELVVVADSSNEARLFNLQQDYPDLSWQADENATVDDLLQLVWRREIGCTVANSNQFNIKRRFYPELQAAFTIEEGQPLAWTLAPEWRVLSHSIEEWLQAIETNGTLLILRDRHFDENEFDYVDMRSFVRRIQSRLPALIPLFRKAAEQHDMPWTLLAAQAYQESHWNRRAKSPTGVRGIMMLTLTTAKEVGVKSRLDAAQSIMGGASYLRQLERRIPDSVSGEDRWWFALAAYNVGMGHLQDARELAAELDLDPDSWLDLRGVLPLLAQKKYYKDLSHGRARGREPVIYVNKIRNYQNILHAQLGQKQAIHAD
jgi:membrane-bound lytic murein transglycosylase F